MMTMLDGWAPRVLSILRIVTGLLFLEHGTQKLFGFPMRTGPAPELMSLLGVQGCFEVVGGILIILGLLTRPAAFILSGDMAFAYFMSHFPRDFFPIKWRRRSDPVLLCLPVSRRGRRRDLEPRRSPPLMLCRRGRACSRRAQPAIRCP
jgi:putative oxidoreductase